MSDKLLKRLKFVQAQQVREAIDRFHVLGTLGEGQKVWVMHDGSFVVDNFRFSAILRKAYRQSRVDILATIARDTTLLMEMYTQNSLIPPACKAAIDGLTKLEKVYDDQQNTIKSLLERLQPVGAKKDASESKSHK